MSTNTSWINGNSLCHMCSLKGYTRLICQFWPLMTLLTIMRSMDIPDKTPTRRAKPDLPGLSGGLLHGNGNTTSLTPQADRQVKSFRQLLMATEGWPSWAGPDRLWTAEGCKESACLSDKEAPQVRRWHLPYTPGRHVHLGTATLLGNTMGLGFSGSPDCSRTPGTVNNEQKRQF